MKKLSEIKTEDINKTIAEKQEKLRSIRFDLAGAATKNSNAVKDLRRDIARMLTELRTRN
jgi:ribosomal protein L29